MRKGAPVEDLSADLPDMIPELADDEGEIGFEQGPEHGRRLEQFTISHRTFSSREFIDAQRAERMEEVLPRLPRCGEAFHVICSQAFAGFDLVTHFLKLSRERCYGELYLTTLGFSRDNLATLESLIDWGRIRPKTLRVLCGDFFRRADAGLWDVGALLAREKGFVFRSARNHTKIILARLGSRFLVVESSANLRSCRSVESFCVMESKPLWRFHQKWIDRILEESDP